MKSVKPDDTMRPTVLPVTHEIRTFTVATKVQHELGLQLAMLREMIHIHDVEPRESIFRLNLDMMVHELVDICVLG
jgi:hypothetical protein